MKRIEKSDEGASQAKDGAGDDDGRIDGDDPGCEDDSDDDESDDPPKSDAIDNDDDGEIIPRTLVARVQRIEMRATTLYCRSAGWGR